MKLRHYQTEALPISRMSVVSQFRDCSFSSCCVKTLQKASKVGTAACFMLDRVRKEIRTKTTILAPQYVFLCIPLVFVLVLTVLLIHGFASRDKFKIRLSLGILPLYAAILFVAYKYFCLIFLNHYTMH